MSSYTAAKFKVLGGGTKSRADLGFTQGSEIVSSGTAPLEGGALVTNDVTIFNWTATDTTVTPTRVDNGASPGATGNIVFNATDSVAAQNMQTAIRALGGIYATATVVAGATADNMVITVFGGYDITWVKTGGTGTITESGAAGSDTATPGSVRYRGLIPVRGNLAEVKKIVAKGFADNSLDISIKDAGNRTIFSATALDTFNAGADVPFVKLLTADGVAGEDGAAAANTSGGVFDAPFLCDVTTSGPIAQSDPLRAGASVTLVVKTAYFNSTKRYLRRSTGAIVAPAATATLVNLGEEYANIKRIKLSASADTTVAPTITDADGLVVYTKTSTDYTTPVVAQLSHEGVDQANNAVADLLDVVARSPISVSLTGLGSGTFSVETIVEV